MCRETRRLRRTNLAREPCLLRWRLLCLVGIILVPRSGILMLALLFGAAFAAVGFVQPLDRHFLLGDYAAIFVFPNAQENKGNRGGGDVHFGFSGYFRFRLPAKELRREK